MPHQTASAARPTVAIASDHAGYALKTEIIRLFSDRLDWMDLGTNGLESVDYPDYGYALARVITDGSAPRGVGICGSGVGISIALNRFPAVRAALCTDVTSARLSRFHNDANVLALGARLIGPAVAADCVEAFLTTPFEGGRHHKRVEKLSATP